MAACVADRSADQDTVGEARFPTITLEDAIDQREWLSKTLIDFNWTNIIDDQSTRICEPSRSHCDTRYVACMTYNMLEYILLDVTSFLDLLMKESYIYIYDYLRAAAPAADPGKGIKQLLAPFSWQGNTMPLKDGEAPKLHPENA